MNTAIILPAQPRILIINVARFGDTLLMTPAIAALRERWPNAHITVLAHPKRMEVLFNNPHIDKVAPITKHHALLRGWWPGVKQYDVALVYGRDAALIRYGLRLARHVIAYRQREHVRHPRLCLVENPTGPMPAVERFALLNAPLAVPLGNPRLVYQVTENERQQAVDWLVQRGLANVPLVGCQLQSFPTKAYRDWPVGHFSALIQRLLAEDEHVHVLLLGGPESAQLASQMAASLGARVHAVAGLFSMRANAAVISRLHLYIGVDTGPTHLAGALGVPMVALYHCYHRGRWLAPRNHPDLTVIEHPLPDTERSREASMEAIGVDEVWSAVTLRMRNWH